MRSKQSYYLRIVMLITDFIIINYCYIAASSFFPSYRYMFHQQIPFKPVIALNVVWLITAVLFDLYIQETLSRIEDIYRQTIKTYCFHFIFFSFFLSFYHVSILHNFLQVCFGLIAVGLIITRFIFTYFSEYLFKKLQLKKRIMVIGYNETGKKLASFFFHYRQDYIVEGFYDEINHQCLNTDLLEATVISNDFNAFLTNNKIEEVYSTILPSANAYVKELADTAKAKHVQVKFIAEYTKLNNDQYFVNELGDFSILSARGEPISEVTNSIRKRTLDILFTLIVTVLVLSWLIPIIAIIIKLTSKGSVFYMQNRTGQNNQMFKIYKFRTMTVADSDDTFVQASKNDQRITPIGRILRKTSLDEIPQFINVLLGQMSIVGPRPHPVKLNETYVTTIDNFIVRHFVKPGITGWAQVNGYRGETEGPEKMLKRIEYDIQYVENWSLMTDIKIICMTVINVVRGEKNAY